MFYVISKSKKNGSEHIHHGGRVARYNDGFYPMDGYKTLGVANREMRRLISHDAEWNARHPEWADDCEYRVEEH